MLLFFLHLDQYNIPINVGWSNWLLGMIIDSASVYFVPCCSIGWALVTFKEAIYEDPGMFLSNWNPLDQDPCDWSGVLCSPARDHVTKM